MEHFNYSAKLTNKWRTFIYAFCLQLASFEFNCMPANHYRDPVSHRHLWRVVISGHCDWFPVFHWWKVRHVAWGVPAKSTAHGSTKLSSKSEGRYDCDISVSSQAYLGSTSHIVTNGLTAKVNRVGSHQHKVTEEKNSSLLTFFMHTRRQYFDIARQRLT